MAIADTGQDRPNGRTKDFSDALKKMTDDAVSKVTHAARLDPTGRLNRAARSPRIAVPTPVKAMHLSTDRVRARPAISPTLSMNIGMTAVGLGLWGLLFPNHVRRTLGVRAPGGVVQALFGLRELVTGVTLAGDPTKAGMLWARVGGDIFDIVVLKALDSPRNPSRGGARAGLAFVLAVTALDLVTAIRMTNVQRNCDQEARR